MKRIAQLLFFLALVAGTVYVLREEDAKTYRHATGPVFGTTYHIIYSAAEPLDTDITRALTEVDLALSAFNPASALSAVNAGRQDTVRNALFWEVFDKARTVSEQTGGAFDITVAPLVNAWGFGFKHDAFPTDARIDSLRRLVGWQKVSKQQGADGALRVQKAVQGMMLDCSSIAKGYGADRVAAALQRRGVENYMVEIGGEIVARGKNDKGAGWKIGVQHPVADVQAVGSPAGGTGILARDARSVEERNAGKNACPPSYGGKKAAAPGQSPLFAVLRLKAGAAVATSGNYRRFYIKDGVRYAHTIDPRTGRPANTDLLSATIFAADCATADAWATACMVVGSKEARHLLAERNDMAAYLIYAGRNGKMEVWASPALERWAAVEQ